MEKLAWIPHTVTATGGATTGAKDGRDKSPWSFDYGYTHANGTRAADNHGVRVRMHGIENR